MLHNKAFCVKPWTAGCVRTNGDITLCCQSRERAEYNLKTSDINAWWTSEFVADIRTKMLANQLPNVCMTCASEEATGSQSLRQRANAEYKIFEQYADKMLTYYNYPTPQPIEMEIQLTNLCNLKCLMCSEIESSSIQSENKVLKIQVIDSADYTVTPGEIEQLQAWIKTKPQVINLRGGEPLIVPEIKRLLKWAIDSKLIDNTLIHITTNATRLTQDWLEILTAIPKLRLMASVDAVGPLNDYIRSGSDWAIIETNIKALSLIPNVELIVHAAVQNLNILAMGELISWCRQHNYYLQYQLVTYPEIFRVSNLPAQLIAQAKTTLGQIDSKVARELVTILDQPKTELWNELQTEIDFKDALRKTSILDTIPEFRDHWHAKKD